MSKGVGAPVYARSWAPRAAALAAHALRYLANRTDVWGAYIAPERRVPTTTGQALTIYTAPAKRTRGRVVLSKAVLRAHFVGEDRGAILGLHTTAPDNTSRWLAFDLDNHDETRDLTAPNLALCARLISVAAQAGLAATVEDSGGGGLHVWVLFDAPTPTADVYALGQAILAETRRTAPDEIARLAVETYPKQPALPGLYGNWLRLPGRHHTRDHWSRIREGRRWHIGMSAADAWLAGAVNDHRRVPRAPASPSMTAPTSGETSEAYRRWLRPGTALERRIARYREELPTGLTAGSGRSDVAFHFARFLVVQCEVSDARALQELAAWNVGNATPLQMAKLEETIANAHRYNSRGKQSAPSPQQTQRAPLVRMARRSRPLLRDLQ